MQTAPNFFDTGPTRKPLHVHAKACPVCRLITNPTILRLLSQMYEHIGNFGLDELCQHMFEQLERLRHLRKRIDVRDRTPCIDKQALVHHFGHRKDLIRERAIYVQQIRDTDAIRTRLLETMVEDDAINLESAQALLNNMQKQLPAAVALAKLPEPTPWEEIMRAWDDLCADGAAAA